jgi:serine protease Do/serine protease DegQ
MFPRRPSPRAKLAALSLSLALSLALTAPAALPQAVGDTPVPTLAPMIKRVSPAVVNIATRGTIRERAPQNPLLEDPFFRRFFDFPDMGPRERQFQSAGSGVIFDAKNGYIVTNAHVVDNATEITVTLQDGRDLAGTVVGSDVPSDVAVLKVPPNDGRGYLNSQRTSPETGSIARKAPKPGSPGIVSTAPPQYRWPGTNSCGKA